MKNTQISVLIPVYNEEQIINQNTKRLFNFLKRKKIEFEILICDNGSTDSTAKKGKRLDERFKGKVKFFSLPERGVGHAFKKNVLEARYNNLICIDMDLSVDLSFIERFTELLKEYDIIIGSKQVGKQRRSLIRILMSSTFIILTRILLGIDYTDYSMAAKAFKRKIIMKHLDRITSGSSYVINMIYLAKRDGYKIKEIPVLCEDKRQSKFNLFHEVFHRFSNLVLLFLQERLLK